MTFPLTYCPLLREYHAIAIGFNGLFQTPRSSIWRRLVGMLSQKCPLLEVLQVTVDSDYILSSANDSSQGDWPVLPSLTTLSFANKLNSPDICCVLTKLNAPRLGRIEFRYHSATHCSIKDIRFPAENDGRVLFSIVCAASVTQLLSRIPNAADLQVELDADSIIDGDPSFREAETWESRRSPAIIARLRGWWESVQQNIPKVSWVVPSSEGEGSWKRLGGADLSLDDAIAYLDHRMGVWLKR
ncbi:hypothetical protein M407DRAFT_21092 [Tulasnella calospora MUT 4182]|nr:hypothetical protein M407DRAFT_21092 [Tulasnella calospora MUT 4182]